MLIAHTTNLTEADEKAFEHAVALCARSGARLATVYAGSAPGSDLPTAGALLQRWGVRAEVKQDRIVRGVGDDAAETVVEILQRLEPDLVVCSTHARVGMERVFVGSVAEAIASNIDCPTLLLPLRARSLLDPSSGILRIERILVPAHGLAEAKTAVSACVLLSRLARIERAELILAHAEDGSPAPNLEAPPGFTISRQAIGLPLEKTLLETAKNVDASFIAMATHGHDSLHDVVFGSHTERVLHGSPCPLLWVPLARPE